MQLPVTLATCSSLPWERLAPLLFAAVGMHYLEIGGSGSIIKTGRQEDRCTIDQTSGQYRFPGSEEMPWEAERNVRQR